MKRLILYGDSNTYGYDPRGFLGMRYPVQIRWATAVREHLAGRFEVVEEGLNGRMLPRFPGEEIFIKSMLESKSVDESNLTIQERKSQDMERNYGAYKVQDMERNYGAYKLQDILSVMLGTNDILLTDHPNAALAVKKMEVFVRYIKSAYPNVFLIIIAPPLVSDEIGELKRYYDEGVKMNMGFEQICKADNISFFDASKWNIDLGADGVHFSEEGHRRFATEYLKEFEKLLDSF